MPAGSSSHAGSVKKVLDARLGQALQSGSPADISAAYKALADLHFEMRNMAVADELYAFSALHSRGIESNNATMTSEYGSADADESENQSAMRQPLQGDSDDARSSASFAQASVNLSPRSSQYPTPRGGNPCTTLSVTVLEAQSLASLPATAGASHSVFCTVTLECPGKPSITARTDLVPYSDSPKWNARFEFRVDDLAVHQGIVNVAIMSRSIFSPSVHPTDAAGDHAGALQLAVSRIGVVRSIRLHQIDSGNGSLQRWFTVSPAPEQEVGTEAGRQSGNKCCLALMLATSESKVLVGSRTATPGLLSPTQPGASPATTPLLSPRSVHSRGAHNRGDDADGAPSDVRARESGEAYVDGGPFQLRTPEKQSNHDTTLLKQSLMSDMALLKRSLSRKPDGKVWFEAPAIVALTLDESFDDISVSQEARRLFQDSLAEDIAAALGLARRQILVFSLRRGSVIATIGIIVPGGGPSPQELTAQLQKQILDPKSVLMCGEVTRKVTSVLRLDELSAASPPCRDASEASDSAIVMASPRLPVVFEGGSVHASRSPPRCPESPQDVPAGFALPRSMQPPEAAMQSPETAMGARARVLQEQDGAHNPCDSPSPKSPMAALAQPGFGPANKSAERRGSVNAVHPGQADELGSILSARKKQVDEATGTRRTSPGAPDSQAAARTSPSRQGHDAGDARQSPDASAGKPAVSAMSLDFMYDKVGRSSSGGLEGASLGLGPVKYMYSAGTAAGQHPVANGAVAAAMSPPAPAPAFPQPNQAVGSAPVLANHAAQHPPMGQGRPGKSGSRAPGSIPVVVVPLPPKWQKKQIKTLVCGTIAHAPRFGHVQILDEAVVIVDSTGKVLLVATKGSRVEEESEILAWVQRFNVGTCTPVVQSESERASGGGHMDVIRLARGQVLVPGFIDTHIHAPQYSYTGTATDKPLMEWLNHYTFPAERRLADEKIAARVYSTVVERTLRSGTTTALYFATIHLPASKILADIAHQRGQRAFVGKVCMDRHSPADYCETTQESLAATEAFIQYVRSLPTDLVQPVITPRFIPTCTPELLRGLGQLARKYECHVQSHISESHDEMQFVADLHPGEGSDADIFDRHGLLTDKCVMAHGVHLNKDDADLLRLRGTAVAHCPLSNFFFGDGVLATAKLVAMGNKVGLGSDVAGGYCPCMLSSIRNAVVAHRALRQGGRHSVDCLSTSYKTCHERAAATAAAGNAHKGRLADMPEELDWRHAFNLATVGGAQALGIEKEVGTIEAGKSFDAVLLDVAGGGMDLSDTDDSICILEKLLNLGSEHNVSKVWVKGRSVHHKPVYRGRPRPSPEHRAPPSPGHPAVPQLPTAAASPSTAGAGDAANARGIPTSAQPRTESASGSPRYPAHAPGVSHSPAPSAHVPLPPPTLGSPRSSPGPSSPKVSTLSEPAGASGGSRLALPLVLLPGSTSGPASPELSGAALAPHSSPHQETDLPAPPPRLGSTSSPDAASAAHAPASPELPPNPETKRPSPAGLSPLSPPEPMFTPPDGIYDEDDDVSELYEHSFSDTDQDVGAC